MSDPTCPHCGKPTQEDDIACLTCVQQLLDGWVPDATDLTQSAGIKPGGPTTPTTQWATNTTGQDEPFTH